MDPRSYRLWLEEVFRLLKRAHLSVEERSKEWVAKGTYGSARFFWWCPKAVDSYDEFDRVRRSFAVALAGGRVEDVGGGLDIDGEEEGPKTFREEVQSIFTASQQFSSHLAPPAVHELETPEEALLHIPPTKLYELEQLTYVGLRRRQAPGPVQEEEREPSPVRRSGIQTVPEPSAKGPEPLPPSAPPPCPKPEVAKMESDREVSERNSEGARSQSRHTQPRMAGEVLAEVIDLSRAGEHGLVIFAVQMAGQGLHDLEPHHKARLLIEMARAYVGLDDHQHAAKALQKASKYMDGKRADLLREYARVDQILSAKSMQLVGNQ